MTEVIWTDRALDNLDLIRDYIKQFNPRAAMKVAAALKATGDSLGAFPYRGRLVRRTDMREVSTDYPYIIRYRVQGPALFILRIRHTARRPTTP